MLPNGFCDKIKGTYPMPLSIFSSRRRSTAAGFATRCADQQGSVVKAASLFLCPSQPAHSTCAQSHSAKWSWYPPCSASESFTQPAETLATALAEPAASPPHAPLPACPPSFGRTLWLKPAPPPQFLSAYRRLHDA